MLHQINSQKGEGPVRREVFNYCRVLEETEAPRPLFYSHNICLQRQEIRLDCSPDKVVRLDLFILMKTKYYILYINLLHVKYFVNLCDQTLLLTWTC